MRPGLGTWIWEGAAQAIVKAIAVTRSPESSRKSDGRRAYNRVRTDI